jgi:predicted MFS family arabinose efflux permease
LNGAKPGAAVPDLVPLIQATFGEKVAIAVSSFLQKFLLASRTSLDARGRSSDIQYGLLIPLLLNTCVIQMVYALTRVTTSYRAIELHLSVVWLGVISATFAILPIFVAVWVGRYIDRGNDARAAWIGSALLVASCTGFRFWADSVPGLLLFTALLGISHVFMMASQQMLCIRSAGPRGRDSAFGNYLVAASIGQGLGPYIIAWTGGSATLPPTDTLFTVGLIIALVSLVTAAALRPGPKPERGTKQRGVVPVRALLREPGLAAVLVASVITITAQDLITIYLPLLGTERNMSASDIGTLLTTRSVASLVSRLGYAKSVRIVGRVPLTLASMMAAGIGFAFLAMQLPLSLMYAVLTLLGLSLGLATTLSLTNVVDLASSEATGTVMSLRITGNRIGQVAMPFMVSVVASATGVEGIFIVIALSLAASGISVHLNRQER